MSSTWHDSLTRSRLSFSVFTLLLPLHFGRAPVRNRRYHFYSVFSGPSLSLGRGGLSNTQKCIFFSLGFIVLFFWRERDQKKGVVKKRGNWWGKVWKLWAVRRRIGRRFYQKNVLASFISVYWRHRRRNGWMDGKESVISKVVIVSNTRANNLSTTLVSTKLNEWSLYITSLLTIVKKRSSRGFV